MMRFKGKVVNKGSGSVYILVPKYAFENGELALVKGEHYWIDVYEFKGVKRGK